jgi:hypothetical protein
MITRCFAVLTIMVAVGCASQSGPAERNAVADFIVVSELQALDVVRFRDQFNHKRLDDYHVLLSARDDRYLVQFRRRCHELDEYWITPDVRYDRNLLRAGIDTIRGCRIDQMFAVDESQAQELESLGKAPKE